MKKVNVTISMPPEWFEVLKDKAKSKSWFITHYIRELVRADLNLQQSITVFERPPRRDTRKASANTATIQLRLPRRAQDIIMGMAAQTGWSISSIVQRILETDLAPLPSRAIIRPINPSHLLREFSESGKALGAEFWEQYYRDNPKKKTYKLEVSTPLDWPDALQAKADMSATTVYLLVRDVLMKRLFGKEYLTADI